MITLIILTIIQSINKENLFLEQLNKNVFNAQTIKSHGN